LGVIACAAIANASNQTFIFQGTFTAISTTITNPYDSSTASFTGTYNLNTATYSGQGSGNTLLMTNAADFITLDSGGSPNVQTVVNVQRIITGNGNDVLDMASANFSLPGTSIFGGSGNELIWANVGGDTISLGNGTDLVDAGPGDDLIKIDVGHDTIEGGTGTDTAAFVLTESSYTITRTGQTTFTITGLSDTTVANLSNVEFAQFTDQTLDLSTVPFPEPSGLALVVYGIGVLGARRRRSRVRCNRR
jgi:Ca2+-binding RTX toxin-like protein